MQPKTRTRRLATEYCSHCLKPIAGHGISVAVDLPDVDDEILVKFCSRDCANADRAEHESWLAHGWNEFKTTA